MIFGGIIALISSGGPTMGPKALPFFGFMLVGIFGIGIGIGLITLAMILGIMRSMIEEKRKLVPILKEVLQFALSCLIYGFTGLMCLGFFLMFDQDWEGRIAGIVTVGVVSAVSVVITIFFRKHRKKHPVKLSHVQMLLIMALCVGLSGFFLYGGIMQSWKFAKDAASGFELSETMLEDVKPMMNYNHKSPNTYYLKGYDETGKETNYEIDRRTYQEWEERSEYEESMTAVIYYYTNTRVVYAIE